MNIKKYSLIKVFDYDTERKPKSLQNMSLAFKLAKLELCLMVFLASKENNENIFINCQV